MVERLEESNYNVNTYIDYNNVPIILNSLEKTFMYSQLHRRRRRRQMIIMICLVSIFKFPGVIGLSFSDFHVIYDTNEHK